MALVAVKTDGQVVHEHDTVVDFRGTPWEFVTATRARSPYGSGKVLVRPEDGGRMQEFYDKVFDLTVEEA